jgi:hypothetical protein
MFYFSIHKPIILKHNTLFLLKNYNPKISFIKYFCKNFTFILDFCEKYHYYVIVSWKQRTKKYKYNEEITMKRLFLKKLANTRKFAPVTAKYNFEYIK